MRFSRLAYDPNVSSCYVAKYLETDDRGGLILLIFSSFFGVSYPIYIISRVPFTFSVATVVDLGMFFLSI